MLQPAIVPNMPNNISVAKHLCSMVFLHWSGNHDCSINVRAQRRNQRLTQVTVGLCPTGLQDLPCLALASLMQRAFASPANLRLRLDAQVAQPALDKADDVRDIRDGEPGAGLEDCRRDPRRRQPPGSEREASLIALIVDYNWRCL